MSMAQRGAEGGTTASAGIPRKGAKISTTVVLHDKITDKIWYSLTDPAMFEKMVDLGVFNSVRNAKDNMKRLKAYALEGTFKLKAVTKG